MYLWQLRWLFVFDLLCHLGHPSRILQLHLALTWLILRGTLSYWMYRWSIRRWSHFRLIWHYISREYSLLSLLSFDFECGQRAELVSHSPRCLILADTNILISMMVHAHVHLILDSLFHRWAVRPSGISTMDLNGINRSQHALLELGTLAHHLLLSILWRHDTRWARRIHKVARLDWIKLKISRSHVAVFSDFRQLSISTNILQFRHPGSFTCLLAAPRTLHSIQIVPSRIVEVTMDLLIAYLGIDVGYAIIWFHSATAIALSRSILLWVIHILESVFVEVYWLRSVSLWRCLLITVTIPWSAHDLERISFEPLSNLLSCQ